MVFEIYILIVILMELHLRFLIYTGMTGVSTTLKAQFIK
jgi:hypothetical protein